MMLNNRWTPLRKLAEQQRYWNSPYRFNTLPAGRRSGKTEIAKRKVVKRALSGTRFPDPNFFAGAPTRDQAKRIFWKDLKLMVPKWAIKGIPSETELSINLVNGASIWVVGMDKPERIEGMPWDGGVLDEFGNMKANAWGANVRPALADRTGWCDFIGVPEGRNHYYKLDRDARKSVVDDPVNSSWGAFHWVSADVLPAEEIEQMRHDLDPLTFDQEANASFVSFAGRVYYCFNMETHCQRLPYNPHQPIAFCFDFNVEPGVAAILQEMELPNGQMGTGCIGEVWIPRNSNTPAVCKKLIADWKNHQSKIFIHGDATGGSRGTAKLSGSDWDIIEQMLGKEFGSQIKMQVPRSNPRERSRVNAFNARLKNVAGEVRFMVDPSKAPHVVDDLEGVRTLEGGSGEIDKKRDPDLTHISDGIGYYIQKQFPIEQNRPTVVEISYA